MNRNSCSKRLSLGLPVIGQTLQLLKAMRTNGGEEWLHERARKYGPIWKFNILGTPTVFLGGQTTNKFIHTADESTFSSKQPTSVRRLIGERNIMELNGQDHGRLRGAFLSFLKPEALKQSVAKMDEEIRLHLDQHWHHNQEIAFFLELKGEQEETSFYFYLDKMFAVLINLPFTRFNRGLRARSKAAEIIRELIHEKRGHLGKRGLLNHQDFITSLLSMRDETDLPLLTDEEIVDNCVVAMIAGHDTSSTLLTILIKLLGVIAM